MSSVPAFNGLVPDDLRVRSARIILDSLAVKADIGFHDFEVGAPQTLNITVEVWLSDPALPDDDDPELAWNYDLVRREVERIATERRYNLQETLAHRIFDFLAARRGIRALRVRTTKPDVYAEAEGVGIEIASFEGLWPDSR